MYCGHAGTLDRVLCVNMDESTLIEHFPWKSLASCVSIALIFVDTVYCCVAIIAFNEHADYKSSSRAAYYWTYWKWMCVVSVCFCVPLLLVHVLPSHSRKTLHASIVIGIASKINTAHLGHKSEWIVAFFLQIKNHVRHFRTARHPNYQLRVHRSRLLIQ